MPDAHWARAECRATRVAQTAPAGPAGTRRSPLPVVNAATGPNAQERQGSSQPATEHPDSRPPLRRSSRLRLDMPHGRRMLAMVTELLRYRPSPDRHNDWLQRIEELVAAAGDSVALSFLFVPQPSHANGEEQDAPPPPPWSEARPEPRQEARPHDRPHEPRARPGDEANC
ncbi:hypothetical protein D1007_30537 [Hordeum vulgare]|nr:hypothetical protein D1007_30537 [Hordeum vulgare]